MLLDFIDMLECPKCGETSRLWEMRGEMTDSRMTNGNITCPKEHTWEIKEEILRLDEEEADEEMEFFDRPKTGFPDKVKEQERMSFLDIFREEIEGLGFRQGANYKVYGNVILFMKYLKENEGYFAVIHPNEETLRQVQELAAKERMYDKMTFIRAENANFLGEITNISILPKEQDPKDDLVYSLDEESTGTKLWSGENVNLYRVGKL